MKNALSLICMLLALLVTSCAEPAPKTSTAYGPVKTIDFYSSDGKRSSLDGLIQKELEANRKPVLYFGAEWCGPCRRFRACLSDPLMREALDGTTFIMIDMDADSEEERISAGYNVHAIPAFIRINKDGSVIKHITSAEWDEDVPQEIAPVIKEFLE